MAKASGSTGASNEAKKRDRDRRYYESWLHDALELSLFDRFSLRRGLEKGQIHEKALILHGPRSGSHPDFALLDASRKLILVELKRGPIETMKKAEQAAAQVRKYAANYATRRLGELAQWYCQHGVDVNTTFGYRNEDYIVTDEKGNNEYGRLNRWSLTNLPEYRKGCADTDTALAALGVDYSELVQGSLDGLGVDDRLEVARCILIAEEWPTGFDRSEAAAGIELWTYPAPAQWAGPGAMRAKVKRDT